MKKIILATLCMSLFAFAQAKPYPKHDLTQIIQPNRVNFTATEPIIQDLSDHAKMYPTQFDNEKDKALATQEASELARIFDGLLATEIVTPQNQNYHFVLLHAARINWIAHNLDVPNAADRANLHYQTLLKQVSNPDKANILGEYGNFLASSGQIKPAIQILKQAVQAGNTRAKRSLAMAYLSNNQKDNTLKTLREYTKAYPNDAEAKEFLNAIQNGRVEIKTVK